MSSPPHPHTPTPTQPSLCDVLAVLLHEGEVAVLRELLRPAVALLDLDLHLLLLLLQAALSLGLGGLHDLRRQEGGTEAMTVQSHVLGPTTWPISLCVKGHSLRGNYMHKSQEHIKQATYTYLGLLWVMLPSRKISTTKLRLC